MSVKVNDYQELFNLLADLGLTATETNMMDIENVCQKKLRTSIAAAMTTLEELPGGGIGEDGPTMNELLADPDAFDDADFYYVQLAWRQLEKGLK